MKKVIGLLMIIAGVIFGIYVGAWVCFIGGIVDVITQIRADELDAVIVACGVAKVLFSTVAGWISCLLLVVPGFALLDS